MKGERRSPRKGQSVEFADFRNYVPGDDPRFVDWNTYARLEKLFLKMFLEEAILAFLCSLTPAGRWRSASRRNCGSPCGWRWRWGLSVWSGAIA